MQIGKKWFLFILVVLMICTAGVLAQGFQAMGVTNNIIISEMSKNDDEVSAAYNPERDEFLVVWRYSTSAWSGDIWGRIIKSDGTPVGPPFPICTAENTQQRPDVAYNRLRDEYMVIWQDDRNAMQSGNDIYGIRLDMYGQKIFSSRSLADSSFIISNHQFCQYRPRIAHNYTNDTYLVVWEDTRNYGAVSEDDIYGQRLDWNASLLSPYDAPSTEVNFPVSVGMYDTYHDYEPDVAYHGSQGTELNEWLVVWTRYQGDEWTRARIWAERVRGTDGKLLNTYGEEAGPATVGKTSILGGPPWWPAFPVSHIPGPNYDVNQYLPRVESNGVWIPEGSDLAYFHYPIPEFLVVWSDHRIDPADIYGQRVAYFPDSTAVRMGLKPTPGADSLFTAVLLDQFGDVPDPVIAWVNWGNYPVTTNPGKQDWSDLAYNQYDGEFFVVWNDWREVTWNADNFPRPPADIYGHRLFLDPGDSSLVWLDDDGTVSADISVNIPVAAARTPDEGNNYFAAPAYGLIQNEFLIAFEFDADADDDSLDIHGAFYAGTPQAGILARLDVTPGDVDLNPGL